MKRFQVLGLCALLSVATWAVPAYRGGRVVEQADGQTLTIYQHGDEFCHWLTNEAGETVVLGEDGNYRVAEPMTEEKVTRQRAKSPMYQHAQQTRVRKVGALNLAPRGLFILANYKDSKFQAGNSQAEMDSMMNAVNYTHQTSYGSARRYFIEQSGGQYQPVFDVVGPVTLDNNASYYGGNDYRGSDQRPATMILHACKKANEAYPELNFADYDNDHDGYVDFVYVIFAGKGEADGGAASTIWPHSWSVQYGTYYEGFSQSDTKIDGVYLGTYACSGELNGQYTNRRCGIGTLCHEFSHVLGLPDYYDTEYDTNYDTRQTPSEWSLMDGGSYNSDGEVPPCYSAYDKWYMGWSEPELLNEAADCQMTANDAGYYITQTGAATTAMTDGLRYVVENRQQSGWDKYLPGHGMLVWKVNYNQSAWDGNTPNNTANAPKITVVSATGNTQSIGKASDPFPGTYGKTSWTPWTKFPLTEIQESNGIVAFKFMGGAPACTGYSVSFVSTCATMTADEGFDADCVKAGMDFEGSFQMKKGYEYDSVVVTMGGRVLSEEDVEYMADETGIIVSDVQGDVVITLYGHRGEIHFSECDAYSWTASKSLSTSDNTLGEWSWTLAMTGSTYMGYENNKGAQLGSGNNPATQVSLTTSEAEECLINEVKVQASRASKGTGELAVYIDDTQVGQTVSLTTTTTEYTFSNTDELQGDLEIRYTNTAKALYLKSISVSFVAPDPTPTDLQITNSQPAVIGKRIVNGQLLITIDGNAPATYNAQGQIITK